MSQWKRIVEEGAKMHMVAWIKTHGAEEVFAVLPLEFPVGLSRTSDK